MQIVTIKVTSKDGTTLASVSLPASTKAAALAAIATELMPVW